MSIKPYLPRMLLGGAAAVAAVLCLCMILSGGVRGGIALPGIIAAAFAFGASLGLTTLPLADERGALLKNSALHLLLSGALFFLLCMACHVGSGLQSSLFLLSMYAVLYVLIWLSRWLGWWADVLSIRAGLGLAPKGSPLNWKPTLVYLPLLLLLCCVLPAVFRWIDRTLVVDVPVLTALVLPFLILPVAGFFSALFLGRRAGFCPLFPLLALALYLPSIYLALNSSALFHGGILFAAALLGNLIGAALHRNPKRENKNTES